MTRQSLRPRRPRATRSRTAPRRQRPSLLKGLFSWLGFILLSGAILGTIALGIYMFHLDSIIRTQFEGKRWAVPARVYARALEMFPGMTLSAEEFADELELLRYRLAEQPRLPGTYARNDDTFEVMIRGFAFWDGVEEARHVKVAFNDQSLTQLNSLDDKEDPSLLRLEPVEIAGIYPSQQEDRILVKREEIPPVLVDALIAVEDRTFYEHFGIDLKGIARAFVANLKAGRTVQGGSTLTQQLVKNYFLSNERTLTRKINEALMAILVDWHYSKDEILEVYGNEVYLGQDGNRAIHGLGLASRFYFDRSLTELDLHHVALLVGLINGPSKYDPRRHPERAKERRALMLDIMVDQNLISMEDAVIGKQMPLDVSTDPPSGITRYPAFLGLVRQQLREYYREEDLTSEGLQIFTTLDPQVQNVTEQTIIDRLPALEKTKARADELQAAAVVTDTQTGEVLAVVGGRDVRLAGFNRALDAQRPIGSLIKPAIYLTALEYPGLYTLATLLDDSKPLVYTDGTGKKWSPKNYDKRYHGQVMLRDALAKSYNIPTVRLGLDLDVIQVIATLERLGVKRDLAPYPSLLLGAVDLSPMAVAQMYQTFASGGFRIPLRAIRAVTASTGEPLQRYPLNVEKAIEPGPAYLITQALQRVVQAGTATSIKRKLSPQLGLAGKTGITDDYRDSWFAGYSGNRLTVIWVGRDDNKPIGLSGSSGALPLWTDVMGELNLEALEVEPPSDIKWVAIDPGSGLRADKNCQGTQTLPFIEGSEPRLPAPCSANYFYTREYVSEGRSRQDVPKSSEPSNPMGDFFRRLLE